MCGRFTLRASARTIAEQFGLLEVGTIPPRYNIAPTQPVAAVRLDPEAQLPDRQLVWLRWGLVPSWARDARIGAGLINARAESAGQKPAFRAALRRRRCLVLADGFYEWQRVGARKQPYFIRLRDDRPFAFAGIWESWEGPEHSALATCAILTTEPNELMAPIHDRMPVILAPEDYTAWLDPTIQTPESLRRLLRPYPSDAMLAYPVSPYVNDPRNDTPQCIAPVAGHGPG